jgi:hypothetical protein
LPKKTTKPLSETDLYAPVCRYLTENGYTVRGEVMSCDVAAVRGDDLIVVELKRSLNLSLIVQGVERQKITDSVYVAVPRPANRARWMAETKGVQKVLRRLELGLILVGSERSKAPVEIIIHPAPFQRRKQKRIKRAVLQEIEKRSGDFNVGGSTRRKLVTAYRENAIQIACCLDKCGPMTPKQLRLLGTGEKTHSILYRNVYSWFDRVEKGLYSINDRGRCELDDFPELRDHFHTTLSSELSTFPSPQSA